MTFPRFTIEQSDQEFYTSQSGMALIGLAINRYTTLTLRQRKDKIAETAQWIVNFCTVELLKKAKATMSTLST